MYENGDTDYLPESRPINPWLALALVFGVILAIVLVVVLGVSTSPSGGCGGG